VQLQSMKHAYQETFAGQKTGVSCPGVTLQKAARGRQKAPCILDIIIVMSFAVRPIVQAIIAPRAALMDVLLTHQKKIVHVKCYRRPLELLTMGPTVTDGISLQKLRSMKHA